jgi:hypothetical protein
MADAGDLKGDLQGFQGGSVPEVSRGYESGQDAKERSAEAESLQPAALRLLRAAHAAIYGGRVPLGEAIPVTAAGGRRRRARTPTVPVRQPASGNHAPPLIEPAPSAKRTEAP